MHTRITLPLAVLAAALWAAPAAALDWSALPLPGADSRAVPAAERRACPPGFFLARDRKCYPIRNRDDAATDLDRTWRRYDPVVRYEPLPEPQRPSRRFIFSFGSSR